MPGQGELAVGGAGGGGRGPRREEQDAEQERDDGRGERARERHQHASFESEGPGRKGWPDYPQPGSPVNGRSSRRRDTPSPMRGNVVSASIVSRAGGVSRATEESTRARGRDPRKKCHVERSA